MKIIGHIPLDSSGCAILGGTRRFKVYKTPALALAAQGNAVDTTPVTINAPEEGEEASDGQ
ncbi:hypothetical protein MHM88_11230 [Epibacterium sp. MM17-32]|uniref:hypothetical protein n=1 Tax=Epibacterium sp. MM17-32 TaxID=2917734 RepID=UPI001EF3EBED|nr:hypothetical protein [Epibacterium sp. MM17-32]MCG7628380.1 hypothetical protein [Epibacterium sp. MM17-32]